MPRAKKPTDAKPAKTAPAKKVKADPVVEAAPAPVAETPEAEPSSVAVLQGDFTGFMAKLQQVSTLMSELKQSFRALEKKASRELRGSRKGKPEA